MNPLPASFARSPELFPHRLDYTRDSVSFVRITEAEYAKASFLDGRIVGPQTMARSMAFTEVGAAVAETALSESAQFIFHIGHVGSTLLSRLLGNHPALFSVREPEILRSLASIRVASYWDDANFEAHLSTFLKLWSRTFHAEQRALVKATSYASELAPEILARAYRPKAIFMFTTPENFLASILDSENSPGEAKSFAPSRAVRINHRLGSNFQPETMSIGEIVAMGWACEMAALIAAPRAGVMWLDFDRFLADPAPMLAGCFKHLDVPASDAQIQAIVSGPDMRLYSKAQQFGYDAMVRKDTLAQARAAQSGEIKRGLNWLDNAAAKFPQVATTLGQAT